MEKPAPPVLKEIRTIGGRHDARCGICLRAAFAMWVMDEPPPIGCAEGQDDDITRCGFVYNALVGIVIPYEFWRQISPTGDDGGLLCPSCICSRLHAAGLRCEGAFMSGPIESVDRVTMSNLRRVENIELAIEGRDNAFAAVRVPPPEGGGE